jgi:nitroreductase
MVLAALCCNTAQIKAETMVTAPARLSPLVEGRWSPRSFLSTPLPEGTVQVLLDAAHRSASAGNTQPWRFIYAEKDRNPEAFDKMADLLTGNNRIWAPHAPLLICAIAQEETSEGRKLGAAHYDTGQAVAWLTVQASEMGLFVHQMGGFERERTREVLNIPEKHAPVTMIAVGYLGRPDALPEDMRERELVRSSRRALEEIAFIGHFPS